MGKLINTIALVMFAAIFMMGAYLGQSQRNFEINGTLNHTQVEDGFKQLQANITIAQDEILNASITNTSAVAQQELINIFRAGLDFTLRIAFSMARFSASFGYNHPDINYQDTVYTILTILIVFFIIENLVIIPALFAAFYLLWKFIDEKWSPGNMIISLLFVLWSLHYFPDDKIRGLFFLITGTILLAIWKYNDYKKDKMVAKK
jgi:hypothetical protein